jgi:hypothetical protein
MNSVQFRQGDVFLISVNPQQVPSDATRVEREGGRVVLAHGEATGHSHAIADRHAVLLSSGAERYLRVSRPVSLYHEEHEEIRLPPATYRVVIQREYQPGELPRTVID